MIKLNKLQLPISVQQLRHDSEASQFIVFKPGHMSQAAGASLTPQRSSVPMLSVGAS